MSHTSPDRGRHRFARGIVGVGLAIGLAGAIVPAGLASAADTAAPVVNASKHPAFVKGAVVTTTNYSGDPDFPTWYTQVDGKITWSATDASGICGYSLWSQPAGDEASPIFENQMITSYTVRLDDYDGTFGGGSGVITSYLVTATDCAGNTSAPVTIPARFDVLQDDGTTPTFPRGALTYSGTWSASNCTCWSALTTRKSTQQGASFTYTGQFDPGDHIGLVMAKGPDRGKFQVYVDGVLTTSVDTYSATKVNRSVVWFRKMGVGTHTIKVVNVATSGRPRIDLDAVLLT